MQNKKKKICQKILCAVNIEKNGQKFLWLWRLCLLNRETKCENLSVCFQTKQRWRGHSLYDVLVKVAQCDDKTADDSHFTVRDTHTHTHAHAHMLRQTDTVTGVRLRLLGFHTRPIRCAYENTSIQHRVSKMFLMKGVSYGINSQRPPAQPGLESSVTLTQGILSSLLYSTKPIISL